MKTRFTLTFTVDLPYPDEEAYPGCSTPDEAVEFEKKQFKDNGLLWLEMALMFHDSLEPFDLQLEGHVIESQHEKI